MDILYDRINQKKFNFQLMKHAMNSYIGGPGGTSLVYIEDGNGRAWRSLRSITKASKAYLLLDKSGTGPYSSGIAGTKDGHYPAYRHNNKTNILFIDLHVNTGDITNTYTPSCYSVY